MILGLSYLWEILYNCLSIYLNAKLIFEMGYFDKNEVAILGKAKLLVRAASHPLRQEILSLIKQQKNICVTDIYKKLRLEQSIASQQLGILRRAKLVSTKREGKVIYYSVNEDAVKHLIDTCTTMVGA
jgi:DNA-binding transcriptional ArsR family regulator